MKVSFNKDALAEALGLLTNVVPARTPKPILRCVHISAGDKDVRISATDLETGISCFLSEVQIDEGGDIVIQADKLAGIGRESRESGLAGKADKGKCCFCFCLNPRIPGLPVNCQQHVAKTFADHRCTEQAI